MSKANKNERYFVSLVNQSRAESGLSTLQIEKSLNDSSDAHSLWMLDADVFSHTGVNGSSSKDRMVSAGLDLQGNWRTAENIGYVSVTGDNGLNDEIRDLHQMLLNSPGHAANIYNPDFSLIGIGLKVGKLNVDGRDFKVLMATQNFASTDGKVQIDGKRQFSSDGQPAPEPAPKGPDRDEWRQGFDGEERRHSGPGTDRNDDFQLGRGADRAQGLAGDDWCEGGGGNDSLSGGDGNDVLMGQRGADRLTGGNGSDSLMGGGGRDRLLGGQGNDLLEGGTGNDGLSGHRGNDTLSGQDGADMLKGQAGKDWLSGGDGNDSLNGGSHADTLDGGAGNDILAGGGGADVFLFEEGCGADTIRGYQAGTDRIHLDGLIDDPSDVQLFIDTNMRQTERGVIIDFGDGDSLFLAGRDLTSESIASDIVLV